MNTELNKEVSYNGYKFNIKVELDIKTADINKGKRYHTITINDMGVTNYYKKLSAEHNELVKAINTLTEEAKAWVDKRELLVHQQEIISDLEVLGFKLEK